MSDNSKELEDLVETVMRAMGYDDYENYNSEKIREHFRKILEGENDETVVREQQG